MDSNGAAQSDTTTGWQAPVLDVSGPGTRGRGSRGGESLAEQSAGDRGTLWIADAMLCFSGRRDAWVVPLGWLGTPEGDLAGVMRISIRGDGHARPISFRFERGAADGAGLAAAIKQARLAEPDARDRRALQELLALAGPELRRLDATAAAPDRYATRVLAAASRLRSAWLPSWGVPATRLRDASLGMLVAAAEAADGGDGDAAVRYEQAVVRWRNVCEDLRGWCNLAEVMDLPAVALPEQGGAEPATAEASAASVPAAVESAEPARAEAKPSVAPVVDPRPPAPVVPPAPALPQAEARPPQPIPAPVPARRAMEQRDDEDANDHTVIAGSRDIAPSPPAPAQPPAQSPAWDATVRRPPSMATSDDEDMTVIVSQQAPHGAPPMPAPAPASAGMPAEPEPDASAFSASPGVGAARSVAPNPPASGQAQVAAPVTTGPGRPGSGDMTMLYRRKGGGLNSGDVARKELKPDDARIASTVQAFLDIGHRFRAVRSPNFVRILDVAIDPANNAPFIDMEFVEGESVSTRQRRGTMPADQALTMVEQLAAAIDAVHAAGLIHGDVRPQNVLIEPGGRTVLLEPSVACEYALEHNRGTIYGELPYLTPERVSGEASVANSDIYALGTLAFALLAGRPPFNGEPAEIFSGHAEEQPPSLDEVLPGAPRAASVAIARTLAKSAYDRPTSATTFAAELRAAFAAPAQSAPSAWNQQPPPQPAWGQAPRQEPAPQAQSQPREPAPPQQSPQRAPGPLGGGGPSPLGRGAPGPLGRRSPAANDAPPDDPPDDMDRTVIVRPPR